MSFTVGAGGDDGGGGDEGGDDDVPSAPTLISPSGTINDSTPTYTWNSVSASGLNRYQVQVTDSGEATVYDDGYDPNDCTGSTCSLTPPGGLANGQYTWHVRARTGSGWGPWSNELVFTVDS